MAILDFFPAGMTPRPEQRELLIEIERRWKDHDVFAITAPTAAGKSALMATIAAWQADKWKKVNILAPTNLIVEQIAAQHPMPVMRKMAAYRCADHKMSCAATKAEVGKHCDNCPYTEAKRTARKSYVRAMNFHVLYAQKLHAEVQCFDEAHQLLDMLTGMGDIRLRRSKYHFPLDLRTVEDFIGWAQGYLADNADEDLQTALLSAQKVKDSAVLQYKPFYRDTMLWVQMQGMQMAADWMWPRQTVKKIVLLSATLAESDLYDLGLLNRRVAWLYCPSSIPPAQRELHFEPAYNLALKYRKFSLPLLTRRIHDLLLKHEGQKGILHAPYGMAEELRSMLNHPRLIWHDRDTKAEALRQFREAPPESGAVLVASGLYEGIDLPYDAARWQILATVPFLSWGDERIKAKALERPDWYDWEAIKRIIQATGRIVRAPDDFGVTYLFDNNFERLLKADEKRAVPLIPPYFRDAVRVLPVKRNLGKAPS